LLLYKKITQNRHKSIKLAAEITRDAFTTASDNELNDEAYGWPSTGETYAQTYMNNMLGVRIRKQRSDSGTKFARIFRSDSKLFEF